MCPPHVVFADARRDDDVLRLGAVVWHALKSSQARGIEAFDDFHHGGGFTTGGTLVAVSERAALPVRIGITTRVTAAFSAGIPAKRPG
jgi:hypothetical protein